MKTIGMIRSGKAEVYDPKVNFFDEDKIKEAQKTWKEKQEKIKGSKPVTLKDYHRKNLIEDTLGDDSDEDMEERVMPKDISIAEEQEQLRRAFKDAIAEDDKNDDDDDDIGGFLTKRERSKDEQAKEEEEYKNFLLESMAMGGVTGIQDWRAYANEKSGGAKTTGTKSLNPNEAFLMDYILNRGWVDKEVKKIPTYEEIVHEEHIDDDQDDKIDEFEKKYNFRFEEEGGAEIVSFARNIEGSMRKKDTRRTDARTNAKQRKEEEKQKKTEELKRLKNLKKAEIRERLKKIADVAGVPFIDDEEDDEDDGKKKKGKKAKMGAAITFDDIDLDGDFDADKFDQMMQKKFGDEYYAAEEDNVKPVFDDDEEGWDIGPDGYGIPGEEGEVDEFNIDGIVAGGPKTGVGKVRTKDVTTTIDVPMDGEGYGEGYGEEVYGGDEDENFIMDADYLPGGDMYMSDEEEEKPSKKEKKKEEKKKGKKGKVSLDDYLEEYYQLDYEDMIGDIPTRFRYRKVAPDAPQRIPLLKKLAPFRPPDKVQKDRAIFSKTKKKREQEFQEALKSAGVVLKKTEEEKEVPKRKLGQAAQKALKKKKKKMEGGKEEVNEEKKAENVTRSGSGSGKPSISSDRIAAYSMPKRKNK
ncbi:KRI1-like family-domain-containing protein [Chytridium lagenaria]|nr:KRI1-like family-domain-containing protein [Chytridium lagenaria]